MKKGTIVLSIITLICVSILALPAFGAKTVLRWNLGTEPPTLDPVIATDTTSIFCDEQLFLGLTDFIRDVLTQPKNATRRSLYLRTSVENIMSPAIIANHRSYSGVRHVSYFQT